MNPRNRRARLDDIRRVAEALRESPVEAPDFTSSILDRVDAERPFLAPSVRRRLPWVRMGFGACIAMGVLTIAVTHRMAPQAMRTVTLAVAPQPTPISEVVQCVTCGTTLRIEPPQRPMLALHEQDATRFLRAMAMAASISENDGRGANPVVTTVAATLPAPLMEAPARTYRVVSMEAPAAQRPPAAFSVALAGMESSTITLGPRPMAMSAVFSADVPRTRVIPSLLEHDLDGSLLPR